MFKGFITNMGLYINVAKIMLCEVIMGMFLPNIQLEYCRIKKDLY